MTGYTVHTGSSEKFSQGWDEIFKRGSAKKSVQKTTTKRAAKKTAKKKKKKS